MFLQLAHDRIKAIVTQWKQLTRGCGSTRHNPEGLYLFEEMGDHIMRELEQILAGDGYAAPPSHSLEGSSQEAVHQLPPRAPHSIYAELWQITFWQQITLDWIAGVETPFPASPRDGFPTVLDAEREYWKDLCQRFFAGIAQAAAAARDERWLDLPVRCPSRPGNPVRVMTVREQLENLAAHNAYHLGRIVLLRQLLDAWPPASGGFTW